MRSNQSPLAPARARRFSSSGTNRSAYTTDVPRSPLRTLPPSASAWRKVGPLWPEKPCRGAPKDQHVDPGIIPPGRGVWQVAPSQPPSSKVGPRHAPGLKFCDDIVGKFIV
ncbi:hypothetical protein ASC80_16220 [Afipia sp. Root123D2]|nr:hypothetical protein ASC80_16220 [Afipia sp. Root123D2]